MSQFVQMQTHTAGDAIVVFPDAIAKPGDVSSWDLEGETDLDFVTEMIESIGGEACVDERRVFAMGFSRGGTFTNYLGCQRGERFRAISPAEGTGPTAVPCKQPVATLVYHRVEDDVIAFSSGEKSRDIWLDVNGCSSKSTSWGDASLNCVDYQGCTKPVVFCADEAESPYKHDLRYEYREPIWQFFEEL
jgi:polyhydroxybutyrate depolymerase